jgi:hypothetical protein
MRTRLNHLSTFLRDFRGTINDEMIESVLVTEEIAQLTVAFPSESALVQFGTQSIPTASVEKIENEHSVYYRARLTYKKRQLTLLLKINPLSAVLPLERSTTFDATLPSR